MKNGIYKVKPWEALEFQLFNVNGIVIMWEVYMERNCPKSRQIRVFNDRWNISGEEFPVCQEMFEEGPI